MGGGRSIRGGVGAEALINGEVAALHPSLELGKRCEGLRAVLGPCSRRGKVQAAGEGAAIRCDGVAMSR